MTLHRQDKDKTRADRIFKKRLWKTPCQKTRKCETQDAMKRLILPLFGALILVALTGCESMQYAKFNGEQKPWPTGSSFTDAVFDVPVYRGLPERPYEILGSVQFNQRGIDWNQGDIKQATALARKAGGDAILLMPRGADPSPTASSIRQQLGITGSETVAVVVKWK